MDTLYEMFEGFSEGMMADMNEEQRNRHLSRMGATIVYDGFSRRVYINTAACPYPECFVYEKNIQDGYCKKVDSLELSPRDVRQMHIFGHAYFHPEEYGIVIPNGRIKPITKWGLYKEHKD